MVPYGMLLVQAATTGFPAPDITESKSDDSAKVKEVKSLVKKMIGCDRKSRLRMPEVEKEMQKLIGVFES